MDVKGDTKANVSTHTDTEYSAANYNATRFGVSHRRTIVEQIEDYERQRLGTSCFGTVYDIFLGGWRAGLLRAFIFSFVALIVNISVYTWLFRRYDSKAGTATIKSGTCASVRGANTGIHAALNVASTLILGASTYAMQGMTSPSRQELDVAHARGNWMEIGTQSVRNLFYIRKSNAWVWALLALTGLPFHLFFNAVFFTTTQTNQYAVAVVQESIFNNTNFEPTEANTSPMLFKQFPPPLDDCEGTSCSVDVWDNSTVLRLVQNATNSANIADFVKMDPLRCMQTYSSGFMRGWGDLIIVASNSDSDNHVLYSRYPQRSLTADKDNTNPDPYRWICQDFIASADRCKLEKATAYFDSGKNWTVNHNRVSYCLAREIPDTCELQFNKWLMLPVVVFGAIKTIVIACLLIFRPQGRFLHTPGDAIASFLEDEDHTTKNMCLVSSKQIRKHGFTEPYEPQVYTGARPRWLSSANTTEFFSTIGVSAFYIIVLTGALAFAIRNADGFAFASGLGVPDIQSLASFQPDDTGSSGIIPTLLIANIPQLGFSLLYVVYMNIWSKLLVAHEFDRLTQVKKGLRVSERPRGQQRASHFFTIPARYALPLMVCSAALHWLCSQSFFMVRIDGVDAHGTIDEDDRLVRLGYSAKGVTALISLAVAMMVSTVCMGWYRRLWTGLGETSMSVLLSAACHPERLEVEPWLQGVQWGDVSEGEHGSDKRVARHLSFTARLAKQPIHGQVYR